MGEEVTESAIAAIVAVSIQTLIIFGGLVAMFTRLGGRLDLLSQRLGAVETKVTASEDVKTRLAVVETNAATTQKEVSDLRRGHGWITQSDRTAVDGRY